MDRKNVEHVLNLIREIKGSCTFYDVHSHPFEVVDGASSYAKSSRYQGLYSSSSAEYVKPAITDFDLREKKEILGDYHDKKLLNKMLQLNRRRIYAHSGPAVFCDQMRLSGVDKVVLLPVMAKDESGDQQLHMLSVMFGGDPRFLFGYCVPNDIPNNEVAEHIKRFVNQYNVVILKIHPSLQDIDLSKSEGKDRIESILAAAKEVSLKVVIHGGLSPGCKDADAIAYGSVSNLQHIDWSITPETVVIAHCGSYGHSPEEVSSDILPCINRLLSRYENLVVDTSALEINSLSLVFSNININRVCFGSDTLYEKQWASMVKMWCALRQSVNNPEESLIKIASENPLKLFQKENVNSLKITDKTNENTEFGTINGL